MRIAAHSYLNNHRIFQNGELLFETNLSDNESLKAMYQFLELDYPKFYKMDALSKIGILACEVLLKESLNLTEAFESVKMIFMNTSSSFSADQNFQHSYLETKKPSPSHFVYTLANIPMGELAIKYKIYGENIFFISEKMNAKLFVEQIQFAFQKGTKHALCAWIDINPKGIAECFLFLMTNSEGELNPILLEEKLNTHLKNYRNE